MSKKISVEEFLSRFYKQYPEADITPLNYTAISNPLSIRCNKCGKVYNKIRARSFITSFPCCGKYKETQVQHLENYYNKNKEFDFVKQIDHNYIIIRHNTCGNEMKRTIKSCLDSPTACSFCQTAKKRNMLSIQEVQETLNEKFFNEIQILDYNGQLEKNHYKCLKCGLIFVQQHTCLLQSRGCPKCDRYKSMGERQVSKYLDEQKIYYKEQVSVKELPLQHFDFGIYDDNNNLKGFIEVQGEQHFEKRKIFRDSLEKIQERDNRKREYCKKNKIPLYELIYKKGRIKNLDILSNIICSTTISAKESTP